jgi:carbonic anhydrase
MDLPKLTPLVLLALVLAASPVALGCKAPEAAAAQPAAAAAEGEGEKEHEKDAGSSHASGGKGHGAAAGGHAKGGAPHAKKYTVPFAAESDKDDPLAQTRGFFQNVFSDNAAYMRNKDAAFFKAFQTSQKPRATIVACSDSRVQSPAFDATPENDDFTIRNIGNQIPNSEGSVEYGVHHLKTPVLFIMGHTGCGAVKAAMGDYDSESDPIRHELDAMKIGKRKVGVKDDDPAAWLEGVVQNVHEQVAVALAKFDEEVASGTLTIVGGVYDFRNDMKQGTGKVVLVNVNGHKDAAKVQAFERGIQGLVGPDAHAGADTHRDAVEIKDLKDLRDVLQAGHDSKEKDAKEAKDVKVAAKDAHAAH